MAVKIPLKMSDGTPVRTIEELREHFNLADVLGYYSNGRLIKWLTDWYYDEEAKKVKALDSTSGDFQKNLCGIFGVDYSKKEVIRVDLNDVAKKNKRLELLRECTADDKILASVDSVVFNQKELEVFLQRYLGEEIIYLCGEQFSVPMNGCSRKYIGVNNPTVDFVRKYVPDGVDFQDLIFDISGYMDEGHDRFMSYFGRSGRLGMKLLHMAAEKKSVDGIKPLHDVSEQESVNAQEILGWCYRYGACIGEDEINSEEAVKWFQKAADRGHAEAQYELGFCYSCGDGVKKNNEEAVKWYRKAAEQGHSEALRDLGFALVSLGEYEEASKCFKKAGLIGTARQDPVEEAETLSNDYGGEGDIIVMRCNSDNSFEDDYFESHQNAAEQGDADAQVITALNYMNEGEDEKALQWLKMAAAQGHVDAHVMIYTYFYLSLGTETAREAIKWFMKADEQGSRLAHLARCRLGKCYYHGEGVEKNYKEAFRWFQKAAVQESADAQYYLGECYYWGNGVERNEKEAIKWFRKAAEQEHEDAQEMLDIICEEDKEEDEDIETIIEQCDGVHELGVEIEDSAFKWYKKGAMEGNANSQFYLGKSYYHGEGVEENYKEAFIWFQKAAEQGNADAQYYLGECYYYSRGVEEDEEAVKWFRKAADLGHAEAQYDLGQSYYYGWIGEEDEKEAEKWFRKAAEQGHVMAQIMLINNYEN